MCFLDCLLSQESEVVTMKILHIVCSPRGEASESYRLSRKIVARLMGREPAATVTNRVIGGNALPHIDANYALGQHSATAEIAHGGSMAQSDELIRELEDSDAVVIGTPMHNLGVPSALKAWIDHVVRARRTFDTGPGGKVGTLRDRPVFIAIASGGSFSGEYARQPDFLTPYLTVILAQIGLKDLHFFSVQGTGLGPQILEKSRTGADDALQAYFPLRV
ncbi:NAD(P)H dehydrogenase (quinone) [Variovorax paradoxus EPS]|uniref:FMN dependent NADH:quinone oxidoreductase n=2 Tax=Variovorax paradoxus TaxID=34073 RepID=E6V4Q4_VARPE|nr:NAD(P)H dehydrogenase (quinone) [Variovorax paradoxus EPS]